MLLAMDDRISCAKRMVEHYRPQKVKMWRAILYEWDTKYKYPKLLSDTILCS